MGRPRPGLGLGPYDGTGSRSPQWWPSRYGPQDELGAGNELTPERALGGVGLVKAGRVLSLAQELHPGVPTWGERRFHQLILAHETLHRFAPEGSELTAFEEAVSQTYHLGCHVDGLGHVGIAGRSYNGVHHTEIFAVAGLRRFGAESMPQWVTRGVCLDIAALEAVRELPAGFVILPEHLEEAQRRQGVHVAAGDAVLLHTGWGDRYTDNMAYNGDGEEPGCGWAAAHWLTDRRVSLVGADNFGFEVMPFEDPQKLFVVHQHLLAETGTYIVENITTSALAAERVSEFLFVMAPTKVRGATAAMVNPIAVW